VLERPCEEFREDGDQVEAHWASLAGDVP
jgi:hypothetical protein